LHYQHPQCEGFEQYHLAIFNFSFGNSSIAFIDVEVYVEYLGKSVERIETDIVPCMSVFVAYITKSYYQIFHLQSFI